MSWTKRGDWFFCLILAMVTILAYQPAWHGGLLWDDDNCTTPRELRSLDGLRRIWFQPRATAQYYPLLYTSYWVQQRLWGDSTTGYHLVNLLLHIGCVVLVLKILRFLRIPGAELAAIIFALHPVNVETVAWIAERKNTLSGIFALAATLSYLKFDENRSRRSYALAIGLFLLGLLSKTAIVTLPLAWLVIFWWKRGAISWRRDVVPSIPFFFLAAVAGLVTRWFENTGIGYKATILDLSLLDRCLIAGRAFWFQLGNLLWPSNLMFVYPRWEINAARVVAVSLSPRCPGIAGNFMESAAVVPCSISRSRHLYFAVIAFAWFSEHLFFHLFVCSRSLAIFGLPGNHHALRQWDRTCWPDDLNVGKLGWSLESRCWSPEYCSLLTSQQSRMYTDIETLYRTTIARNPGCWMAQVNLGNILYKANRIPEAMDLFNQALEIKPAVAHYSLGNAFIEKGRTSEAIEEYRQALTDRS